MAEAAREKAARHAQQRCMGHEGQQQDDDDCHDDLNRNYLQRETLTIGRAVGTAEVAQRSNDAAASDSPIRHGSEQQPSQQRREEVGREMPEEPAHALF